MKLCFFLFFFLFSSFGFALTEISSVKLFQNINGSNVEVQTVVDSVKNLYVNVYTNSTIQVTNAIASFKIQQTNISDNKTVNVNVGNDYLTQFIVKPENLQTLEKSKPYVISVVLETNNKHYLDSFEKSFVVGKNSNPSIPELSLPLVFLVLAGVLILFKLSVGKRISFK